MRQQGVQPHQERHAQGEAAGRRQPWHLACLLGALDSGDQQRPHRRGDHHAGGEPEEHPLGHGAAAPTEQEHRRRAQGGHEEGEARAQGRPQKRLLHDSLPSRCAPDCAQRPLDDAVTFA